MEIKTKFNFGQRIYTIVEGQELYKEKCAFCEGKGYFFYRENKRNCRESGCQEGYITKQRSKGWYIPKDFDSVGWSNFVVQKIGVEMYNPNNKKVSENRSWIYYMSGSNGTMWNEINCFASIEEAQAECDKRNRVSHE